MARAADAPAAPFTMAKQFSAEMVITRSDGMTMTTKVYRDNDKARSEMTAQGMEMYTILRPDQKKLYTVMPAQKMIMEMPCDPEKVKQMSSGMMDDGGKYELVGPDVVDGVACMKYKASAKTGDGKVIFVWVDAAKQTPVKIAAADGSFTAVFKNFQAGPQNAALFEIPTGYQVMNMPTPPGGMPGGAPPAAPGQ
jgi:hypothetical protein